MNIYIYIYIVISVKNDKIKLNIILYQLALLKNMFEIKFICILSVLRKIAIGYVKNHYTPRILATNQLESVAV